jgi:hypothetical protein
MGAASGPDMITDGLVLCLDAGSRESYPVSLPSNGLYGRRYVGYFNDDVNWFETATLHGDVNQLTAIDNFTSNADFYSWQWIGYFKPSTTENYTFFTSSDDASYLWIGNNATAGFTTANANVNNAGLHGDTENSSTPVSLTKGVYYPIRIQFGENGGGDIMSVSFSTPTISKTRNGLGYYYHGSNIQNTWKDLSNNGNNGTLTNGPLFGEENIGSLLFDGVDDYVTTGFTRGTLGNQTTLICWYRYTGTSTRTYSPIFGGIESNGSGTEFFIGKNSGNTNIGIQDGNYSDSFVTGSNAFDGNYHQIIYTYDNGTGKIYLDGTLRNTGSFTKCNDSEQISIGSELEGGGYYFIGNIAQTQIYNRVLTPAEVLQNYNATKGRFGI